MAHVAKSFVVVAVNIVRLAVSSHEETITLVVLGASTVLFDFGVRQFHVCRLAEQAAKGVGSRINGHVRHVRGANHGTWWNLGQP